MTDALILHADASSATDVKWVATLSDGSTAVEHTGEYKVVPGSRKPWVRLTTFLTDNDLYLTSLRLNFRGRTTHMARPNFDRFGFNAISRSPSFYSLQYMHEAEMGGGGIESQSTFIDLIAHFESYEVHFIQSIDEGNTSWVVVTEGHEPLAPTPARPE